MTTKEIVVLGAGMVGVCSALALQKRGFSVTLIDKCQPGGETSFGNAGMITPSSLIPFNNPKIFAALPTFLTNKSTGFRYNARYVLSETASLLKFLSFSTSNVTNKRIKVLFELIERSIQLHQELAVTTSDESLLRPTGWLKLYRQNKSFENSKYELSIYEDYGITIDLLDQLRINEIEPALKPIFSRGIHIKDALSVASPKKLVEQYLNDFLKIGGELVITDVSEIRNTKQGFSLLTNNDTRLANTETQIIAKQLVIAAGPWSKSLLKALQLNIPMIYERGGHRQFGSMAGKVLHTPIHDVDGSFVATPNSEGVRVTCGVELQRQLATNDPTQLEIVTNNAREGLHVTEEYSSQWFGARPTLPDSLPIIGETKIKGLWLNTGHQHIGFSTGIGSADILAKLMSAEKDSLSFAFSPSRLGL